MNTVESLKQLYVKMGGNLSDSYPEITSGIPVSDYVLIPDCISALNKVAGSSGGGNALTLYLGTKTLGESDFEWGYKNPECTEEFASKEEAIEAMQNAVAVRIFDTDSMLYYAISAGYQGTRENTKGTRENTKSGGGASNVYIKAIDGEEFLVYLWHEGAQN